MKPPWPILDRKERSKEQQTRHVRLAKSRVSGQINAKEQSEAILTQKKSVGAFTEGNTRHQVFPASRVSDAECRPNHVRCHLPELDDNRWETSHHIIRYFPCSGSRTRQPWSRLNHIGCHLPGLRHGPGESSQTGNGGLWQSRQAPQKCSNHTVAKERLVCMYRGAWAQ